MIAQGRIPIELGDVVDGLDLGLVRTMLHHALLSLHNDRGTLFRRWEIKR